MKPLIPVTTQSSDGAFYDENKVTGEEGTIVDAAYMNNMQSALRSVQSEIISILATAGMQPDQASVNQLLTALDGRFAKVASPVFTGVPTAPTAAIGTNTQQLATTAFVKNNAVWVYGYLGGASSGLNLNTLTGSLAGRYWQTTNAGALTSLNYPVSLAGSLDVEKNTANGVEGCVQRYTTYEVTPRVFLRAYHPLTSFWSEWHELAYLSSPAFAGAPTAPTAAVGTNTTQLATTAWVATEIAGIPLPWPQAVAPTGWLKCNGQAFDKNVYPRLAQVYPSGVLPDLRGEFIRGWDDGRGVDAGRALLSTQGDAIRNIVGFINGTFMKLDTYTGAFYDNGNRSSSVPTSTSNGNTNDDVAFDASRVVPTASENRPRNIAFNYIVRAA
ncbi:tail fiber protein [Dickeya zeae]|uniref:tail fiber protein n=1 Tax=Dickeya zeae TaxID=204042 RepID=UPI002159CD61|nr:tail fiber protein [Dickeya zeae]